MRSLVWRHSFVCLSFSGSTGESRTSLWIARSRGCVIIALECKFVILNEVKNLIRSMCYKTEILRLGPQNDIATQPLDRAIQRKELDSPVEPENDKQTKQCRHTNDYINV